MAAKKEKLGYSFLVGTKVLMEEMRMKTDVCRHSCFLARFAKDLPGTLKSLSTAFMERYWIISM